MEFTSTKPLPVGFFYKGQKITQVTVRPVKVRDTIEAIEELGPNVSDARMRIGIEARQVSFDGVPDNERSTELLLELCDPDYRAVTDAIDEVEKKQLAPSDD